MHPLGTRQMFGVSQCYLRTGYRTRMFQYKHIPYFISSRHVAHTKGVNYDVINDLKKIIKPEEK